MSLRLEGFTFASGLQLNDKGKPNGKGAELLREGGCGSGFLVKEDGTIATNDHVARRKLRGIAVFQGGATYEILHLRVYSRANDLALLKMRTTEPQLAVKLGDSNIVQVMDKVLAVGNPLCQELAVSDGIVNQIIRDKRDNQISLFRHSAATAPGNSGGAIYKNTEAIAVLVGASPPDQIHYAIPINKLMPLLDRNYDRAILEDVFPTNIGSMVKKFEETLARNGQVQAKPAQGPAVWKLKVDLWALQDVAVYLKAQSGKDLDLAIWSEEGMLIGYGEATGSEGELVLLANGPYQTVTIAVLNYDNTPVNFGLKLYQIAW